MLAKGWILGLQFYTLFKDGLYFEITKEADKYALRIKDAFAAKGIPAYIESLTNQQFVVVTEEQMNRLGEKHVYEYQQQLEDGRHCIRFCTSWSTKAEDVDTLIADLEQAFEASKKITE
jgi:threonine aldolase